MVVSHIEYTNVAFSPKSTNGRFPFTIGGSRANANPHSLDKIVNHLYCIFNNPFARLF